MSLLRQVGIIGAHIGAFFYGVFTLSSYGLAAGIEGNVTKRPTKEYWQVNKEARDDYWNLKRQKPGVGRLTGFSHRFYQLKNGGKLHYVTNATKGEPKSNEPLLIMIHGWPDSNMLWENTVSLLGSSGAPSCTIMCVDLPGHGGSDGLPNYGPDPVLDAISEFIMAMREETYGEAGPSSETEVIIVGHDWGALIGLKLASKAPQLGTRFILASAAIPELLIANIRQRVATAQKLMRAWTTNPTRLQLLANARRSIAPFFTQLGKSSYVFVFRLPMILASRAGLMGNRWFLRLIGSISLGLKPGVENSETARRLAVTLGPLPEHCDNTQDGYGESVRKRAIQGNFRESIRLYREGLAPGKWSPSLEILGELEAIDRQHGSLLSKRRSSPAGFLDDGPDGSVRAPLTLFFGEEDPAGNAQLCLEGISDYLAKDSQVFVLPGYGHWLPTERNGGELFAQLIKWRLDGGKGHGSVHDLVQSLSPQVRLVASR